MTFTHLDLFAGVGGFSRAVHWLGGTTVGFVEWDLWNRRVLAKIPVVSGNLRYNRGRQSSAPGSGGTLRGLTRKGESLVLDHDTSYPTHRKNDRRVLRMYGRYCAGLSLAQVAAEFGVTRQSVYKMFHRRGMELRPRPESLPSIRFNGETYTMRAVGYYGRTRGNRSLLHRDVWEHHHGPIPEGYDVHHVDEDRTHNDIDNLECLPKDEHTRLHQRKRGRS